MNNLNILKTIPDQELLNELKRRNKVKELKKPNGEIESYFIWKRDILNTNQEQSWTQEQEKLRNKYQNVREEWKQKKNYFSGNN
ncbi:hypothetical protein [endosymbiont GvMRE of Glomus versiforme]|uniref:hypothetical protein n=1 Tax=endosymbiont GvMRE of Glomus versiforme TaxID=2039283 RepID=UPI000EC7A7DE|nr:hypothetical protein [endosymbiont GvMRE of Glomus versiforme]RHZ35776.1 hypothetical protein GvMRE_Ic5g58 [endosymbiont GvMRE of Glomus versiforme]